MVLVNGTLLGPMNLCKHLFDFIFVPKCKPIFKLLDAFIIFFLNILLINTTNLS